MATFFVWGYPARVGDMLCVGVASPVTLPLWLISMTVRGAYDAGLSDAGAIELVSLYAVGFCLTWVFLRRRLRRCRRLHSGCCSRCGYNLTGNTSGVCPECGTAILRGSEGASGES